MYTSLDKALVALIMAGASIGNLLFGEHWQVSEPYVTAVVAVATPILVYLVPNKDK